MIEPCCGSFVISCVHRYAGWIPSQIEASDVSLFSAICGYVITGQDLAQIGYKIDGIPLELTGDPVADGARMLYEQCVIRIEIKGDVYYWQELVKDLRHRREDHLAKIRSSLERLVTVEYTKRSESKGNRGIMDLVERIPDKKYGQKLVYVADIKDRSLGDTLRLWLDKEKQWLTARQQQERAERKQPRMRPSRGTPSATTSG